MGTSLQSTSSNTETKPSNSLGEYLKEAKKKYGPGVVIRIGDRERIPVDSIPSGLISLDRMLGCGGYPKGKIIEMFGSEGGGKTTLALTVAAQAQRLGLTVAYVDAEQGLNLDYANRLGVNTDDLFLISPDHGEQALEVVVDLLTTGHTGLIVVDSVAALVPRAELEGEMGSAFMGLQARMMSQALRKITGLVSRTQTCVIFINQIREKLGIVFGNPETTPGGRALKFFASLRLDVRRSTPIKEGDLEVGVKTKIGVVKNRFGPPKRKVEVDLIYGKGFSAGADLLDSAVTAGIVTRSGAWYYFGDQKLGQGREQTIAAVEGELFQTLLAAVKAVDTK